MKSFAAHNYIGNAVHMRSICVRRRYSNATHDDTQNHKQNINISQSHRKFTIVIIVIVVWCVWCGNSSEFFGKHISIYKLCVASRRVAFVREMWGIYDVERGRVRWSRRNECRRLCGVVWCGVWVTWCPWNVRRASLFSDQQRPYSERTAIMYLNVGGLNVRGWSVGWSVDRKLWQRSADRICKFWLEISSSHKHTHR